MALQALQDAGEIPGLLDNCVVAGRSLLRHGLQKRRGKALPHQVPEDLQRCLRLLCGNACLCLCRAQKLQVTQEVLCFVLLQSTYSQVPAITERNWHSQKLLMR